MMKSILPLHKGIEYSSVAWHNSNIYKNVRYSIRRISLAQRIDMAKRIHELSAKYEFLKSGGTLERTEAQLADLLVRQLYLEWGLAAIEGLVIDGEHASVEHLVRKGPEPLCDEIVACIRRQLELSEEERKNS